MAELTGYNKMYASDTTAIDSSLQHPLGTRAYDEDGNEYIYLTGVALTAAGYVVSYDEVHITTLAVANAKGRVAVAMAATIASTYGWYQIYGKNATVANRTAVATDLPLFLTASAGMVDDADVAGDLINGMLSRSATNAAASPLTVELNYPFVNDSAND